MPTSTSTFYTPNPFANIHATDPRTVRGPNYWSRNPITRIDVTLGEYDDIASTDVAGMAERLLTAMPGLFDHECSIGGRGGFVKRLRQGTYAAHIVEHVALELQVMSGVPATFGRTRGSGTRGTYTVVFTHHHEAVGRLAARSAVEIVQRAFAGTLTNITEEVEELRALAAIPDAPPLRRHVVCGVTGQNGRQAVRASMRDTLAYFGVSPLAHDLDDHTLIEDVSPAYILESGLPFTHSEVAIILDALPGDVPAPYREPDRAARLVSVVAETVPRHGAVVCPADTPLVHAIIQDAGCRLITFPPHPDLTEHVRRAAACAATVLRDLSQRRPPAAPDTP